MNKNFELEQYGSIFFILGCCQRKAPLSCEGYHFTCFHFKIQLFQVFYFFKKFHLKDGLIQLSCMHSLEKMTHTSKYQAEFKEVVYKRFQKNKALGMQGTEFKYGWLTIGLYSVDGTYLKQKKCLSLSFCLHLLSSAFPFFFVPRSRSC